MFMRTLASSGTSSSSSSPVLTGFTMFGPGLVGGRFTGWFFFLLPTFGHPPSLPGAFLKLEYSQLTSKYGAIGRLVSQVAHVKVQK